MHSAQYTGWRARLFCQTGLRRQTSDDQTSDESGGAPRDFIKKCGRRPPQVKPSLLEEGGAKRRVMGRRRRNKKCREATPLKGSGLQAPIIDSLPLFHYNTGDSPVAVFPEGGDRMTVYESLSLMVAFGTLIAIIISLVIMLRK